MSLLDNNGLSAADVAAVTGGNNGYGFGGDGIWWLLVLFLFAFVGGGWGGFGNAGNGGGIPAYTAQVNDIQRGFDQQAVIAGINGVQSSVTNGFAGVNQALCNGFAGVSNGFAQVELGANNRQMANMNQMFGVQQSISNLGYNVATEACADRQAVNDGARDIIAAITANTNATMNAFNAGLQSLHNEFCQDRLDNKDARIADLERQLTMANLQATQGAQTAQILADNAAQTANLRQALNPTPIPAYVVQNPSCCNTGYFSGNCCGSVA